MPAEGLQQNRIPPRTGWRDFLLRAILFANGALNLPVWGDSMPGEGDLVIAADGGTRHALALGIHLDVVIGDFDSITEEDRARLEAEGTQFIEYPRRKDFTDLELALQYALEQGAGEAVVIGALGNRWDQTLANLLLPAAENLRGLAIRLVDRAQEISLLQADRLYEITGQAGDTVSLIPLGGDARGIWTEGLEYPLRGETLKFGASRGVSNVLEGEKAAVRLEEGLLLCVVIHQEGEIQV